MRWSRADSERHDAFPIISTSPVSYVLCDKIGHLRTDANYCCQSAPRWSSTDPEQNRKFEDQATGYYSWKCWADYSFEDRAVFFSALAWVAVDDLLTGAVVWDASAQFEDKGISNQSTRAHFTDLFKYPFSQNFYLPCQDAARQLYSSSKLSRPGSPPQKGQFGWFDPFAGYLSECECNVGELWWACKGGVFKWF